MVAGKRVIKRNIQSIISSHLASYPGQPAVITGMTQTGKTTLVREIGKSYKQFMVLDMSIPADRKLFSKENNPDTIQDAVFLRNKCSKDVRDTLILIRELNLCSNAINWISYYTENSFPFQLIATCSFLSPDVLDYFKLHTSNFKQYKLLPLSFPEFLQNLNDQRLYRDFCETPVPYSAHQKLLNAFHIYSLIGGMPEIVSSYLENEDLTRLEDIYEKILSEINSLLNKSSKSQKSSDLSIETLLNAFPFAATRIIFNHFGNENAGSREIARTFRTLEQAMVLKLIYPVTSALTGSLPDQVKSPRLQIADNGLVNYFSGIQGDLFLSTDMSSVFAGQVARQMVGQEIMAGEESGNISFWIRNKLQSSAEVDFVIDFNDRVIPVMVKPGEPGRLRGLHRFIDEAPHPFAVRLSSGALSVGQYQTISGKKYYLMNLPYYLSSKIREHMQGFIRLVND